MPFVRARSITPALRCAACHGDLDDAAAWTCAACATVLHDDCADALERCATPGCASAPARQVRHEVTPRPILATAVWLVPGVAALLWPVTCLIGYVLLEATVFPARGTWLRFSDDALVGGLLLAALLPLALGNGALAPLARAREQPGRHHVRALLGALGGALTNASALGLLALALS